MKSIIRPTTAVLLLGTLLVASCNKDKETKFREDQIAILESVLDKESADEAALKLMKLDLEQRKYTVENFETNIKLIELAKKAEEKNCYNSEKLREAFKEYKEAL